MPEHFRRSKSPATPAITKISPHFQSGTYHELDPDGDLILVLEDNTGNEEQPEDDITLVEPDGVDGQHEGTKAEEGLGARPSPSPAALSSPSKSPPTTLGRQTRLRVSSRHLILASPIFRAMLSRSFSESHTLRTTGTLTLPLPDDSPAALLIILNIVHGRTRAVPRKLNMEMLVEVGVLVDKYELLETVEIIADIWIAELMKERPLEDSPNDWPLDNMMSWVWVTWVFRKAEEFRRVTRMVERESCGEISGDNLPIPASIIEMLNNHRHNALSALIAPLQKLIKTYKNPTVNCSHNCDALILGAVTKKLKSLNLPTQTIPIHIRYSFTDLAGRVRKTSIPSLCKLLGKTKPAKCGETKAIFDGTVASLEDGLCGLDLEGFGSREVE